MGEKQVRVALDENRTEKLITGGNSSGVMKGG